MATTSRYELDFFEAFTQCEEGKFSLNALAGDIARRLDDLESWARIIGEEADANDIEILREAFDFIKDDNSAIVSELDDALERLYDWADNSVFDEDGRPVAGMILCRIRSVGESRKH